MELTCGMPAESSQILVTAASEIATDDPERALYLLSLASWGAAFARDADAIVAIAGQAERLASTTTRRPASCSCGWLVCARTSRATTTAPPRASARCSSSSPTARPTARSPTASAS